MEYDNTNSGVLFRETAKRSDKSPDYTGRLDVEGKQYRIAGWIRDGRNGKFMSLAINPPKERGTYTEAAQPVNPGCDETPAQPDLDDEIPF